MKKYNVDKYTAFNISAQELCGSKMLTPREFEEFYYIIENLKMDKEALLKVIEYCVNLKGKNVSLNYIIAVAKNWAHDSQLQTFSCSISFRFSSFNFCGYNWQDIPPSTISSVPVMFLDISVPKK